MADCKNNSNNQGISKNNSMVFNRSLTVNSSSSSAAAAANKPLYNTPPFQRNGSIKSLYTSSFGSFKGKVRKLCSIFESPRPQPPISEPFSPKSDKLLSNSEPFSPKSGKLSSNSEPFSAKSDKLMSNSELLSPKSAKSDKFSSNSEPFSAKSDKLVSNSELLSAKSDKLSSNSESLSAKSDKFSSNSESKSSKSGKLVSNSEPLSAKSDKLVSNSSDFSNFIPKDGSFTVSDSPFRLPGTEDRVVIYFTSLRGIRRTFQDCHSIRMIFRGFRVNLDERDISMDVAYKKELQKVLGENSVSLPQVFVKGKYIGGADVVKQLLEVGELARLVKGIPLRPMTPCDACDDVRFFPCTNCNGSRKVFDEDEEQPKRCPDCNENGLVRCPLCCL